MPSVFPDYKAPIVRNGANGRELAMAIRERRPQAGLICHTDRGAVHFARLSQHIYGGRRDGILEPAGLILALRLDKETNRAVIDYFLRM